MLMPVKAEVKLRLLSGVQSNTYIHIQQLANSVISPSPRLLCLESASHTGHVTIRLGSDLKGACRTAWLGLGQASRVRVRVRVRGMVRVGSGLQG